MSFCNNLKPDRTPGPISGNPLHNLCERACIQVRKVFDACLKQTSLENYEITLTDPVPTTYTQPLTFVSAASTTSTGVISGLIITPISTDDRQRLSRVQCTVSIPVEVIYVDATNVEGRATGTISVDMDVVMCIPDNAVIPVEISSTVNAVAPDGTYASDLTFSLTACVTVVLKAEAEVELLIPTYGYCYLPPCQNYSQEACTGIFDLPLFPTTSGR